ncbi:MAG TPA: glycosyltransferase family 2 protein [Pyrinomonadaceae bacterium]|nr:glycosyltransferase family 2 protein [Pyrinomonadaceae bacterium]
MVKVVALLAFRDEEAYLPGFFAHLRHYVSEFIVLDDNSADRSADIARAQPRTLLLTRRDDAPHPDHYFEVDNRRALLSAALERGADWVLCCDADERHERRFLEELPSLARGRGEAYALRVRDLWDGGDQYRVDSWWGEKAKFVLFPSAPFADYHPSHALHTSWVPPGVRCPDENILDYNLYHLLSLRRPERLGRLAKFKAIDPDSRYQPRIGYDYLADEDGITLEKIPPGREFEILPEDAPLFA